MIKVVSGADGFDIKKNKSTIRKATSDFLNVRIIKYKTIIRSGRKTDFRYFVF